MHCPDAGRAGRRLSSPGPELLAHRFDGEVEGADGAGSTDGDVVDAEGMPDTRDAAVSAACRTAGTEGEDCAAGCCTRREARAGAYEKERPLQPLVLASRAPSTRHSHRFIPSVTWPYGPCYVY